MSKIENIKFIGAFMFLAFIWGSSFILIKKSLLTYEPLEVSAIRVSLSSLCFAPFVFHLRKHIPWNKLIFFVLVGLTGSGIPSFLYPIAQTEISSSLSGILNAMTPIFAFLTGLVFFKMKFSKREVFGVFIGFLGTVILVAFGERLSSSANVWYALFVIAGTLCYGLNVNLVEVAFKNVSAFMVSAVSFFLIGPPAMIFLISQNRFNDWITNPNFIQSTLAVCVLSIVATVISTIIFFQLIKKAGGVFSSTVSYLIPIVAIMWGILDGESFTLNHAIGMALILSGVYMIKRKNQDLESDS